MAHRDSAEAHKEAVARLSAVVQQEAFRETILEEHHLYQNDLAA